MAMIGRRPQGSGPSFMQMLDGVLGGYTVGTVKDKWAEEQARQRMLAERDRLYSTLGPQEVRQGGAAEQMAGNWSEPAPPERVMRRGPPSLREAQADILRAQQAGVDTKGVVDLLDKTGPKPMVVNGWLRDGADPNNLDRYSEEAPAKGMRPVVDPETGKHVGWMNSAGTLQGLAEQEGAKTRAQEAGKSEYDLVEVPQPDGSTMKMRRSDALGQTFRGQAPADAIRANALATGEGEREQALQGRAASAARQLAVLDKMESLLPDVIAGFGADAQLQGYRALAAAGNAGATRKVAATETFLNQGRVLVSDIIKTFGANPTEGERKYAERMSGADAQLNPETLREGIKLQRERINRDLEAAGQGGGGRGSSRGLSTSMFPRNAIEAEMRRRGLLQ